MTTATTTQDNSGITNAIIKNVTFKWIKIDKPVDNYSGDKMIYDIQVLVPEAREAELSIFRKVRPMGDGMVGINLSKNAFKQDGTDAAKVRCVDNNKLPLDSMIVGNGSVGNVMVMQKPYEIKNPKTGKVTKSGISTTLSAIQVVNLVKYEKKAGGMDFDMEDGTAPAKATAAKADDQF